MQRVFMPPNVADRPFGLPPDLVIDLPVAPSINRTRKPHGRGKGLLAKWKEHADDLVMWSKGRKDNRLVLRTIERFELIIILSELHTNVDLDNTIKTVIDYLRGKSSQILRDDAPQNMRKLTVLWGTAPEGCRVIVREVA